jgi:hypothetical protein
LKSNRSRNAQKTDPLLITLAESIGSTLGTLAAKADVAQKMLTEGSSKLKREGQRLVRRGKTIARTLSAKKKKKSRTRAARPRSRKRPTRQRAPASAAN